MSRMEFPEDPRFAAEPRGTWFSRNWLWFVPSIVVLPMCLCGGCCGGLFYIGSETLRSSEPYRMTIETAVKNPAVIKELGEPVVDATLFPMGGVNVRNDEGDANFVVKIEGPNGEAAVASEAKRRGGKWRLTYLHVTFDSNAADVTIIERGGAADGEELLEGMPDEMPPDEAAAPGEI